MFQSKVSVFFPSFPTRCSGAVCTLGVTGPAQSQPTGEQQHIKGGDCPAAIVAEAFLLTPGAAVKGGIIDAALPGGFEIFPGNKPAIDRSLPQEPGPPRSTGQPIAVESLPTSFKHIMNRVDYVSKGNHGILFRGGMLREIPLIFQVIRV